MRVCMMYVKNDTFLRIVLACNIAWVEICPDAGVTKTHLTSRNMFPCCRFAVINPVPSLPQHVIIKPDNVMYAYLLKCCAMR